MLKELSAAEVERRVAAERVARLGCHPDGRTYAVPLTYACEDAASGGHFATELKLAILRKPPNGCVESDHVEALSSGRSVSACERIERAA